MEDIIQYSIKILKFFFHLCTIMFQIALIGCSAFIIRLEIRTKWIENQYLPARRIIHAWAGK